MLTRIQAQLPQLSKSERRVGEWVLAHPQAVLEQDTHSLARQIAVSQPTLVRFARSMGCGGFQDFRMQLVRGLAASHGEPPSTIGAIAASNGVAELCDRLFGFSTQALARVREALDPDAIGAAIEALDAARRVFFLGFGNGIGVAHEAQRRFMRLEAQAVACTDPHSQAIAAAQAREGDVVVVLSPFGRAKDLLALVDTVHAAGATTLALTTSRSPLHAAARIAIGVDIPDSSDALTPATTQLAELVLIDLLVIGIAARRSTRLVAKAQRKPRR